MKIREYRRDLAESMATLATIETTWEALTAHIDAVLLPYSFEPARPEGIIVQLYSDIPDRGTGWDKTFIVTVEGYGVFGFCDDIPN